jgi:DNA-binding response OmpR family regulator
MNHLLIVDDDVELCTLLTERLAEDGFELSAAHNGVEGLELAGSGSYSLVILDVMLPRMGGIDVLKNLRARSSVPVLMLTARGDDIDRIIGLEVGADDYLPKPFNPRELVARIKAILRRIDERRTELEEFTAGDIRINTSLREAYVGGRPLQLTTIEFAVLEVLVRNPGRALSRTIDVHISNLRRKLDQQRGIQRIKTIRGSGYLLAPRKPAEDL